MPDTFTTVTNLINSPPGQLAAGAALAGIVWKFFERVEGVLSDQTKFEIAVWLLGVEAGRKVEPWPDTFAKVFDRVFGTKHLSWKCFGRSCLASYAVAILSIFIAAIVTTARTFGGTPGLSLVLVRVVFPTLVLASAIGNVLPDYLSLLETRAALRFLSRKSSFVWSVIVLSVDFVFTACLAIFAAGVALWFTTDLRFQALSLFQKWLVDHPNMPLSRAALEFTFNDISGLTAAQFVIPNFFFLWVLPAFFTSIWLWLYSGSGFLLKAARRFDIGFQWFNRKFDIEKKPLQSIGLVAGVLVAVVYWMAVVALRLV